eukprot:NODE_98_length_21025_cov_0.475055.p7 type:complete len:246 gc:universal NODE_98_length_21025_cov_0.475055:3192-3929(+)
MVGLLIFGASWCLFTESLFQCYIVFREKQSRIFLFSALGLFCGISCMCLSVLHSYYDFRFVMYTVFFSVSWLLMVQSATWIYYARVKSLGIISKFDYYMKYVPAGILIFQVPFVVLFNLQPIFSTLDPYLYLLETLVNCAILVGEIILYISLVYKLIDIFEYRQKTKKMLIVEISFALMLTLVLDILVITLQILGIQLYIFIRSFSYIVRIALVVRFFDDLIFELENTRHRVHISDSKDFIVNNL